MQLWNNVRIAFGDQPDLVELADNLSENFESLYDSEVGIFMRKCVCTPVPPLFDINIVSFHCAGFN